MTASGTVVVVDDDPDMRLLVKLVVEATGSRRVVAELPDGEQAIDELEELSPPPVPDVVVMDNRMREVTGLEAARRILQSFPGLPIILFSAFLDGEVEAEAAAIGIAACLPKKDYEQLPSLIDSLLAA